MAWASALLAVVFSAIRFSLPKNVCWPGTPNVACHKEPVRGVGQGNLVGAGALGAQDDFACADAPGAQDNLASDVAQDDSAGPDAPGAQGNLAGAVVVSVVVSVLVVVFYIEIILRRLCACAVLYGVWQSIHVRQNPSARQGNFVPGCVVPHTLACRNKRECAI